MISTIAIVGCGASKAAARCHARELYVGPLFRAARDHVEGRGLPYAILSARWGLVAPWAPIDPYDVTVKQQRSALGPEAWKIWCHVQGGGLLHELQHGCMARACGFPGAYQIEVHAGAEYASWFRELLVDRNADGGRLAIEFALPLEGLEIGQRLAWYAQRRATAGRAHDWWWPEGARSSPTVAPPRKTSGQLSLFGGTP